MATQSYSIRVGLATCGIAAGAAKTYDALKAALRGSGIVLQKTGCLGMCYNEPLVEVRSPAGDSFLYGNVNPENVEAIVHQHVIGGAPVSELLVSSSKLPTEEGQFFTRQHRMLLEHCGRIDPENIDSYLQAGGYLSLKKALTEMTPDEVIEQIRLSGLRGRGGAGFPTHLKWSLTRKAQGRQKYIVCNADEGDPGAFMDRSILESNPHVVLEGMLLAGYAIGASVGYIYIRAEYPLAIRNLRLAIAQAREHCLLGSSIMASGFSFDLHIREGAGAFVCGEETALLMSVEGKRGMPRFRPPFPAESGLFGCPTAINNVETLANIPCILARGAEAFNSLGTAESKGTKVFALAGKVKRGGLVEIPMGMTVNEIVFDIGGGISSGKAFKAVQTGGPSGGCIPASLGDTPVDYESLKAIGAIMGSGGLLIMDEDTCMVDVAKFFLTFTREESCGKCTFCRSGTQQMLTVLERITAGEGCEGDIDLLVSLGESIKAGSLCGLGQTAPNPVLTTIRYFRHEYEAHVRDKSCPAGQCKALLHYKISNDCKGCGLCVKQCPTGAIAGAKREPHQINQGLCVRCGLCLPSCKFDSIHVVSGKEDVVTEKGSA